MADAETRRRELAHHEELYSGFAQQHFAKPAVRAFRAHLAGHILRRTGLGPRARLLSLGCGIGDTELLLAPAVGRIVGVDFSPAAIRQASEDAAWAGIANIEFQEGDLDTIRFPDASFDGILAIFLLHHLPDEQLRELAARARRWLAPGGVFYSLDPNRRRLSGRLGRLLAPKLMERYHTPGERELDPAATRDVFSAQGFFAETRMYDFLSTPLAGLWPGAGRVYGVARWVDDLLVRAPLLARWGSNFELTARVGESGTGRGVHGGTP
ncbi:MAG: class I SAM-dependent methyltransferase [Acidobacteria bacterium]|nr:class I SAM-dependent methyltransferase [Acidobacteriota bacterium]